ncbi:hypothetical protein OCK74_20225 [Chitinophagaceae bacterium LB-8]|uniref:Uncharacterized protein n=1 Tax=Paraflavisolibacter caeni TaxID=2982496 RepID=A0A9X2XPP8_9BACT|nr:hypothetical protein [Paraflavisolibacter caeni]MCU7551459.1 hypothetical protein [Paraflavisolibacter caeni]
MLKKIYLAFITSLTFSWAFAQEIQAPTTDIPDSTTKPQNDSMQIYHPDSSLRIINLNPFFTLHVDSALSYQLQINKNPENYFWYLKNSPVGLKINKDNGTLSFKADKSYFLSGRLKYDQNYKVNIGVQNLSDPKEKIDTNFSIVFYSTEIIPSKVKPLVNGTITVEEGDTIEFKVLCETGSFPIENIFTLPNMNLPNFTEVDKCGDSFKWSPKYDFVKETDPNKEKVVLVNFIGSTRFQNRDTAQIRIIVRDALNYPLAKEEYNQVTKNVQRYVLQLKYTFLQLDKKLRKTKGLRTTFDLTAASTSLTGTVLTTSADKNLQNKGKILPSIGLSMVPIREASVPNKTVDQNQAALIRASIKRLEYLLRDNTLLGDKDWDITKKTTKLKEDLKQTQVQLIDVPIELTNEMTEEQLNRYFNSPRVNKKYRLKTN